MVVGPASGRCQPIVEVQHSELPRFLTRRPVVLDVRVKGDCDAVPRMRTSITVPFDNHGMAHDDFMMQVQRQRGLMAAKKSGRAVLVVCCQGVRARGAALLLSKSGFKNVYWASAITATKR